MKKAVLFLSLCLCIGFGYPALCQAAVNTTSGAALLLVTVADGGPRALQRGYHRPGYQLSPAAEQTLTELQHDYALIRVDGWPLRPLDVYCAVMSVPDGVNVDTTLAQLSRDARVALAQPLQTFQVRGVASSHNAYNDPYFVLQYGKHAAQIEQLHQRATGRGVRIAIVDTGVDRTHPDLRDRIAVARNFVDGDARFDSDIHGTAVAGIVAASANNNIGVVGVAPGAELLALKACWQLDAGAVAAACNSFTLAKALTFAIEQNADIVNLSLSGPSDPLLTQLLQLALRRGMLLIAAQNERDDFPASLPGVIAVTAATAGEMLASAQGSTTVAAEASELLSTSPGGRYDFFSGSSMAAARVTGLSALLRQKQQGLSAAQLLQDLGTFLEAPTTMAQLH